MRAGPLKPLWISAVALCLASGALAFDDFQTWSTATVPYFERDRWKLAFGAELRLDDDSTSAWFGRLSQQSHLRASDRWGFDANLSYIRVRAGDAFKLDTLRLELAGTPSWSVARRSKLDLRIRVDVWLREGDVDEDVTLRLRPRWTFDLDGSAGGKTLFIADEVIYSGDAGEIVQNRLYPIGAGLPVGRRARVDLYGMILSARIAGPWRHDVVIGQSWTF